MSYPQLILINFLFLLMVGCFGPFNPYDWPPEEGGGDTTTTVSDGLVAYWNCDDSLDSKILRDVIGELDASISGGAFEESGVVGGTLRLSGKDNQAVVLKDDKKVLDRGTDDFTISLWVKPMIYQQISDTSRFDILSYGLVRERGFTIAIAERSFTAFVGKSKNNLRDTTFDALQEEWFHLVLLRRSSMAELWVNGVKVLGYSNSDDLSLSETKLLFGNNASNSSQNGFSGYIDEVKMYNRAWDSSTVAKEYQAYKP